MGQRIEMTWQPDQQSATPKYQQIISYFLTRIQAGDWPIGDQLPTQRQLAQQFGVNRSTVSQAMTIDLHQFIRGPVILVRGSGNQNTQRKNGTLMRIRVAGCLKHRFLRLDTHWSDLGKQCR